MGTLDNMIQGVFDSIRLRATFFQSISDRNQLSIDAMKVQTEAARIDTPEVDNSVEDEYIPAPEEETKSASKVALKKDLKVEEGDSDTEPAYAPVHKKGELPGANLDFEV